MDLRDIGSDDVYWIQLAQGKIQLGEGERTYVTIVKNLRFT
jgi:hypothetical protein